jgi:predicted nucleic acid-binding protein
MQRVLVDTSVWVKLFRKQATVLEDGLRLLRSGGATVHPWTLTELMLGDGAPTAYLRLLRGAPRLPAVADPDLVEFLRDHGLQQSGIGLVDLQLVASAHRHAVALWTADHALQRAAQKVMLPPLRREDWGP